MSPAFVIPVAVCAVILLVTIAWLADLALRPRARQAHGKHARVPFADPRDVTDPDATVWLKAIRRDPGATLTAPPRETHHEPPPLADLARVRAGLLALDAPESGSVDPEPEAVPVLTAPVPDVPPEPAAGSEPEPDPDWLTTSAVNAFAPVLELGDVDDYLDRVFAPAEEGVRAVVAEHLGSEETAIFAGVSVAGLPDDGWDLSAPVALNGDAGRHSGGSEAAA